MPLQVRCSNCFEIVDFGDGAGQAVLCPTCGMEVRYHSEFQPQLEFEQQPDIGHDSEKNVWDSVRILPKIRPKAPSLARRLIPPILGGLAAIPISLAILWYGFGRDIGNAGPTVAKFVPWIVPDALRGGIRKRANTPSLPKRNATDDRRFGALGSQSRKPPKPQATRPGFPQLISAIQQLHDTWETDPVESRSQLLGMIYGKGCELVSAVGSGSTLTEDQRSKLRDSIRDLMNQSWFVESIDEATAGNLPDVYPPAVLDYVVFAVESVQREDGDAIDARMQVAPPIHIKSRQVRWIAGDSLASWLPDHGTDGKENRYLILGQVIGRDAVGYTVRVDAVLP